MTTIGRLLIPGAAIAALSVSATALSVQPAAAQPWTWLTERCRADACATYRCDDDRCTRIAPWRYGGVDAGYYTDRSYSGFGDENVTRFDRCFNNHCAVFRCDLNGDRCRREGPWRYH
jgi:hypothetical protein